jgi:hypothetical protein
MGAIATVAVANSAAANAAAAAARRDACRASVKGYEHDTATVTEMQQYAGCVERLHPQPLSDPAVWGVKLLIVLCFSGFFVCGWYAKRYEWDGWSGALMAAALGAMAFPFAAIILYLAYLAVRFLFTA